MYSHRGTIVSILKICKRRADDIWDFILSYLWTKHSLQLSFVSVFPSGERDSMKMTSYTKITDRKGVFCDSGKVKGGFGELIYEWVWHVSHQDFSIILLSWRLLDAQMCGGFDWLLHKSSQAQATYSNAPLPMEVMKSGFCDWRWLVVRNYRVAPCIPDDCFVLRNLK